MDRIYNKIIWEDILKNPQTQAMGQTTKSQPQDLHVGSNGVSDVPENWKSPKETQVFTGKCGRQHGGQ